jgi:hypothetical protein
VPNEHAVLVIAEIIVQVAVAQKKLLADEQMPNLVFGDLWRLCRVGRGTLRSRG